MSEGGGGGPEIAVIEAPPVEIPVIESIPVVPKPVTEPIDTTLPDTPVHTDDPAPSIPVEENVDDSSKAKEVDVNVERNARAEVVSTKEMIRQKLTHDIIEVRKIDPEKKSGSVTEEDIKKSKLTHEQIELLEIYRKQSIIDAENPEELPNDEHIFQLVDKVRDQIAKEALERKLLSGSHLLPLVDQGSNPDLYAKLEQTAFIDDPELISEVFGLIDPAVLSIEQAKIQMMIKERSNDPRFESEVRRLTELDKIIPKISELFENISQQENIMDLFEEIAQGKRYSLVKSISEITESPNGLIYMLKSVAEQLGIDFDPNFFQKHGKTIGKFSLLAALGLMYALMKSGKEQPQGAYN